MKTIKTYEDFINEEINADLWSTYWESNLLGTLGYLASFGVSYYIYKYLRGYSERESVENAKKVRDVVNDSDDMRDLIIKVLKDNRIQNILSQYKEKIENKKITFNEMKTLGEEMKNILGDILTTQEWHLSQFIIDRLSKNPNESVPEIREESQLIDIVDNLFELIIKHKSIFEESRKTEIIDLIRNIKNKDEMKSVIRIYEKKYNKNPLDIIIQISKPESDYIKSDWLEPFVSINVLDRKYNKI